MLIVVQWKMPSGGMSRFVLLVGLNGPYEPSLPELNCACPTLAVMSDRAVLIFAILRIIVGFITCFLSQTGSWRDPDAQRWLAQKQPRTARPRCVRTRQIKLHRRPRQEDRRARAP